MIRPWKEWSRADKLTLLGIVVAFVVGLYPAETRGFLSKTSFIGQVAAWPFPLWTVVGLMGAELLVFRVVRKRITREELAVLEGLKAGAVAIYVLIGTTGIQKERFLLLVGNLREKGYLERSPIRMQSSDELELLHLSHEGRKVLADRNIL